ncbi:MAG: GxxExxY protein [Longimicrobiales bacterium]
MSGSEVFSRRHGEHGGTGIWNLRELNELADRVLDIAFEVHREVGPGISESVYEEVMEYEINDDGLYVERQKPIPFDYKGLSFPKAFYADLVVENSLVIELKVASAISTGHVKQTLTYLRLGRYRLGLILNFGAPYMKDGVKRVINGYDRE